MPELRSRTGKTYRNDDGTHATSLHAGPVHYRDERGGWQEIDSTLMAVAEPGYACGNTAGDFGALFRQGLTERFMRLDVRGSSLALSLVGAGTAPLAGATPGATPGGTSGGTPTGTPAATPGATPPHTVTFVAPTQTAALADGSWVRYPEAFPGVALEYQVLPDGVKETLVLANAAVPTRYRFLLELASGPGLRAEPLPGGAWAFRLPGGAEPALVLAAPAAYDASPAEASGEAAPAAPQNASLTVVPAPGADGRFEIDLEVDAAWLRDPSRRFPVALDPTFAILSPGDDATFKATCATCLPFDDAGGRLPIGTDQTHAYRAALKFDVGAVPAGVTISQALLKLFHDGACIAATSNTCLTEAHQLNAHRITADWSDATQTQALTHDASVLGSYTTTVCPTACDAQLATMTVTSAVQAWYGGTQTNYGLLVKRSAETLDKSGPKPAGKNFAEPLLRPRLDVTWSGGVQLLEPETLHGNGAQLRWFRGPGTSFERYEVHRAAGTTLTPTTTTLLTTIGDETVTFYRDRTAAPNQTFTYLIVTDDGVASNPRTVTLPADGQAVKRAQPGPVLGKGTTLRRVAGQTACANYGADTLLSIGDGPTTTQRVALAFDLRDVPANATLGPATVTLWHPGTIGFTGTVNAHRVTSAWREGNGDGACTGNGATWYETQGGVRWTSEGGDYDSAVAASAGFTQGQGAGWHEFSVQSLVQRWVRSEVPNHGLLLRLASTPGSDQAFAYLADDYTVAPALRPHVSMTYSHAGSRTRGPTVALASPRPNQKVTGSAVRLTAGAGDDRRVERVEFYVGGQLVATDTAAPYAVTWNSTTTADGSYSITAKAYDDVNNVTTSKAVGVTVDNSAPPAAALGAVRVADYAEVVMLDAPGAYLRLGDSSGPTAADASGSGRTGTYFASGVTYGAAGLPANDPNPAVALAAGGGLSFGDHFDFAGTAPFTLEAWIQPSTLDTTYRRVFDKLAGAPLDGYALWVHGTDGVGLSRYAGGAYDAVASGVAPPTTTATHVAVTYDGAALALYVNGAPVTSTATTRALPNTSHPLYVGTSQGGGAQFLGTVDELAVYTTALGESRLRAHHEAGRQTRYRAVVAADAPLGYWRLGETGGTAALDASGHGRTGTYTGGVTLNQNGAPQDDTNRAAHFDGLTGYVSVTHATALDPVSLTVEAWVLLDAYPTGNAEIISKGDNAGYRFLVDSAGRLVFGDRGTTNLLSSAAGLVPVGRWQHVAATAGGGGLKLYADGVEVASSATAYGSPTTTLPLRIGANTTFSQYLPGRLDEVALYGGVLPASRIRAHYVAGATLRGTVLVLATASDDVGVTRVELAAGGAAFGEAATAPYVVGWDTLDPARPAYDGATPLTARAWDTSAQSTTSSPVTVTVSNAAGTRFFAGWTVPTPTAPFAPVQMVYDPALSAAQQEAHPVTVTVTNNSAETWAAGSTAVHYRWLSPGGADWAGGAGGAPVVTDGVGTPVTLTSALAPSQSQQVVLSVRPPQPEGATIRATYVLRADARDVTGGVPGAWFAAEGSAPPEQHVSVHKAQPIGLGLERYYHYVGEELGGGPQHLVNVGSGNSIVRWTPFSAPGRGLSTVLDLTYNALEHTNGGSAAAPVGNGWSLSVSSLSRFGDPLELKDNKSVDLIDGDGTRHTFVRKVDGGVPYWEEPAGVHLFLRQLPPTSTMGRWAFTRPDRVTFYYDADGWPTYVEDRNQNRLKFVLEDGDDPGGPKKRVKEVVDAAGLNADGTVNASVTNRSFRLSYYANSHTNASKVRGKVRTITDHDGSALDFEYYDDGNLRRVVQRGTTDGLAVVTGTVRDATDDRAWVFTYTTSAGNGPALPNAADRIDPKEKVPNQSTRIYGIRDPRGAETTFSYLGSGYGNDRWRLASRTDRLGQPTTLTYGSSTTTVAAPLSRTSSYTFDPSGRVTRILDPLNRPVTVTWNDDHHVERVDEPGGGVRTFFYNANGYLTDQKVLTDAATGALAHTRLLYDDFAADDRDVSTRWKAGRTIPHTSRLKTTIDPNGMPTSTAIGQSTGTPLGSHQWQLGYDANWNLTSVQDPEQAKLGAGRRTEYAYGAYGVLTGAVDANYSHLASNDPNRKATTYELHDANGFPTKVTDPENDVYAFLYDADGLLRWVQDARHEGLDPTDFGCAAPDPADLCGRRFRTYFDYDAFHRLVRQSAALDAGDPQATPLWSGAEYDVNDNVVWEIGPHRGSGDPGYAGHATDRTKTKRDYDAMDRPTMVYGPELGDDFPTPDPITDPVTRTVRRTKLDYDAAGRLVRVTLPKGAQTAPVTDYATEYLYDLLDRPTRQTRFKTDAPTADLHTHLCYDAAGNLATLTAPNANVSSVTCPAANPSPGFTTTYEYDAAHRRTKATDPLGRPVTMTYDAAGNVRSTTNGSNETERREYDERNQVAKVVQPFVSAVSPDTISSRSIRDLTTRIEYDPVGNVKREIGPRAWDASSDKVTFAEFVTAYDYNGRNQATRVALPTSTAYTEQHYVHHEYGANGWLASSSLPVTNTVQSDVPANKKTRIDGYFDTGWIHTSRDPGGVPVEYGYSPEGWQTTRLPRLYCVSCPGGFGDPDEAQRMDWDYSALGRVIERRQGGETSSQVDTYSYDSHGLLVGASLGAHLSHAVSGTALVGQATQSRLLTETQYDTLDRPTKERQWTETAGRCRFTAFTSYDLNGNLLTRAEDGEEQRDQTNNVCTTTVLSSPTTRTLAYDAANQLLTDTLPDTRVTLAYWPQTGRLKQRKVETGSGGSNWAVQQTVDYDSFANGQLYRQTTKNGASPSPATTEEHVLSYETGGIYVGHRTQDVFTLQSPTATACSGSACNATYTYDPRGRLVATQDGHGGSTAYTLDPQGNVTRESITVGGGTVVRNFLYSHDVNPSPTPSNQLEKIEDDATPRNTLAKHFYDARGNLKCVTTGAWSAPDPSDPEGGRCPAVAGDQAVDAALLEHYAHDDFDRLIGTTGYVSQTVVRDAQYVYDPLDRPVRQTERHTIGGALSSDKTRAYTYQGLSNAVTKETHHNGADTSASLIRTKTYALDALGRPTAIDNDAVTPTSDDPDARFTYGSNVHGSVSQLIDSSGAVKASYGYRPYGKADPDLTKGDLDLDNPAAGTDPLAALNAYRYTGKRHDPASRSLDMGARRFSPDPGRFLQQDLYRGALSNLRLGMDPLTQNRYSLAGGNPVSFVEIDGHEAGPVEFTGGLVVGAVEGVTDLVTGIVDIAEWAWGSLTTEEQRQQNVAVLEAIRQDPGAAASSLWQGLTGPIVEDWQAGRQGEAVGRSFFEVASVFVGTKGATKAGALSRVDEVGDAAVAVSSATRIASGLGQGSRPMSVVRIIGHGESVADLIEEAKGISYLSGNEVALVELAGGERALVTGGPGGIGFAAGQIRRLFAHMHPYQSPPTGPSDLDMQALTDLGQTSSYLLEHGEVQKFWVR